MRWLASKLYQIQSNYILLGRSILACIVIYKTRMIFSNCSRTHFSTFNYLMNPFKTWFTMGYFIIHDIAIYCDEFLFRTILQFYGLGNLRAKTVILISFLHFRFDKAICTTADQAKQPGFRIHKYASSVSPIQTQKLSMNRIEQFRKCSSKKLVSDHSVAISKVY